MSDWIAIDWGTSNLRAWAMRGTQAVTGAESPRGMGTLAPDEFEEALLDLVGDCRGAETWSPAAWSARGRAGSRHPMP